MLAWASTCGENIHQIDGSLLKKRLLFVSQRPPSQAADRIWHGTRSFCSEVNEDVRQGDLNWDKLGCWIFYVRTQDQKQRREERIHKIPDQIWHQSGLTSLCKSQLLNSCKAVWCHPAGRRTFCLGIEWWAEQSSGPAVQCPPSMKVPGLIPAWTFLYAVCIFSWRDKVSSIAKKCMLLQHSSMFEQV